MRFRTGCGSLAGGQGQGSVFPGEVFNITGSMSVLLYLISFWGIAFLVKMPEKLNLSDGHQITQECACA